MLDNLVNAWQSTSQLEVVSVAFGLAYVILAARENSWCWPCAFIGTGTAIRLFWDGLLPMEAALNGYYLLMAVYGWWHWRNGSSDNNITKGLDISRWQPPQHLLCLCAIAVLTLVSGYLLSQHSAAKLPYLDSFTTWSAVITTWMVTRKILENWLYWVVINSASIYLYLQREFYLYALLFALYVIIAVFGYFQWLSNYRASQASSCKS